MNKPTLDDSTKSKRIDKWFLRAAQTATVLGVLLAIFGYFYTVRPVYQKALLDESIARKEIELRALVKSLAESYGQIKNFTYKSFVSSTARECIRLPDPKEFDSNEPKKRISAEEELMTFDVEKCVANQKANYQLRFSSLKKEDADKFFAEIDLRVASLIAKQTDARKRIRSLPAIAASNPSVLVPLGSFEQKLINLNIIRLGSAQEEFDRAVERTRRSIVQEFRHQVLTEINSLVTN